MSRASRVPGLLDTPPPITEPRRDLRSPNYTGEVTKQRRSPEKLIQRDIIRALRSLGWEVMDMSQPRASMMPAGLPDLYARKHARRVWIEVKSPTGKLTAAQEEWHARERAAGGTVITARSAADALSQLGYEV